MFPQKNRTIEEAVEEYRKTTLSNATSYGRTIFVDGKYVGDIWCYGIDKKSELNAMLSYCIFDKEYWSKGIVTKAVALFLKEIHINLGLNTIGAFTFSEHTASIRVLEKNGFQLFEEFIEDGKKSRYFQINL